MFFLLIRKLTTDFVVPIMYLRGNRCLEAWREFRQLLGANFGGFALYLLFQIVIELVLGVMILAVVIVTCCIAGCYPRIPYIGAVLLLPLTCSSGRTRSTTSRNTGRATTCFNRLRLRRHSHHFSFLQRGARGGEFFAHFGRDLGEFQLQRFERVHNDRRDDQPREPFVIGGHHIPRRVRARGVADRVLVGFHVLRPALALANVRGGKFPILLRFIEPFQKPLFLLFLRHIQEKFANHDSVADR